ncbi:hypothetical protein KBC89_03495 [Candidatus Woesebacteria bacterium]|nr:hypothetical protein [Candidatus Woesebacteria bacterium]
MILDKIAYVARLSPNQADNDKEMYVEIVPGGIRINVQPADAELIAITDGAYGRTYSAWTTYSGVAIGDRITISGSNQKFIAKGVKDWQMFPLPHTELVLFLGDN